MSVRETAAFWREVAHTIATLCWVPQWLYEHILRDVEAKMSAKNADKSAVEKLPPMPPDEGLVEPKLAFEDTFSAMTVIKDHYFPSADHQTIGCPCGSNGWMKQDGTCGKCNARIGVVSDG